METHEPEENPLYRKFESLDDAYEALADAKECLDIMKENINRDFINEREYVYNPLRYSISVNDILEKAKQEFTDFVISNSLINEYRDLNIEIDRKVVHDHVKESGTFNHKDVINFIKNKYADPDAEALTQIKDNVKKLLPYKRFDEWRMAKTADEIGGNDNLIELKIYGEDRERIRRVQALIKLIDITLNGTKPSKTFDETIQEGQVFRNKNIKSLRYFKNNALKLILMTKEDADKVKRAIVE